MISVGKIVYKRLDIMENKTGKTISHRKNEKLFTEEAPIFCHFFLFILINAEIVL